MNGTSHITIGAAVGFMTANSLQTDPAGTAMLIGVGAISGLMPDMDIDGKLSNRITISHKLVRSVAHLIGFLMIIYSFLEGGREEKWLGIGAGVAIIIIASFITQRLMLTITGLGVLAGGFSLQESWLILLGVFIVIASFVPHRSYTHSILGVVFYGWISLKCQSSFAMDGIFITGVLAYISHLVADMKILPFNKRGVKFFLPLWSKEF